MEWKRYIRRRACWRSWAIVNNFELTDKNMLFRIIWHVRSSKNAVWQSGLYVLPAYDYVLKCSPFNLVWFPWCCFYWRTFSFHRSRTCISSYLYTQYSAKREELGFQFFWKEINKMAKDLLLWNRCEEIPCRLYANILGQLKQLTEKN